MTVQVVRPAGAGHETLYVLLLCLVILGCCSLVVVWHREGHSETTIAQHQIDARRDLTAAEQGIYADLRVAFDEIQLRRDQQQPLPMPKELAAEAFPPFMEDASALNRGGHQWQLLAGASPAYLGSSQSASTAGSFLMLLHDGADQPDIWLNRESSNVPSDFDLQNLLSAGWKQIVTQYDSGVTRQHRH